jgi:hypothetical protein
MFNAVSHHVPRPLLTSLFLAGLLVAGDARAADPQAILAKWATARKTASSTAVHAAYSLDATLAIADLKQVARGPYEIRWFFAREAAGFPDRAYSYVWSMATKDLIAVVERFEGTQTQGYNGPPGTGSYAASGRRVGYYRLALLQVDAEGKIRSETLAYDEATLIGQLTGNLEKVRAPEARTDFGGAKLHRPAGTAAEAQNALAARRFDVAFGQSDAAGTLAYLADTAAIVDFTAPADFDKPQFGGLLDWFYGAFSVHGVQHLLVAAAEDWVLDVFQWKATFKQGAQPVRITDFVLLQFQGGQGGQDRKITRSITFKNGAALARQLGLMPPVN